ncbi:DNA polymerase III subunit delta [Zavarzinia compransoris]|uniref:DNA polymerase III subunit delta n=1 Tax=Zavarzinia marina TaxID=2911065 RepID=UPI001F273306|nr:DNA polymerase III subunit delta [Zavarzinia marina]MCF4167522.1 DNA polymerase III subunit delta [Zavarzinia marina]
MKIAGAAIDRFVAKPDPAMRVVLLFGPDGGLVRERAAKLARTVVPDLNDPFRVTELTGAMLDGDPARLADEAAAISMMGGRRVIRLRDIADKHAKLIAGFLEDPVGDALIVAEAGDLPNRRSTLRTTVEEARNAAALPCYADDAASLDELVDSVLRAAKLEIEPAARQWLLDRLGADRALSRGELDKLVLYMGPGASQVSLDDVRAAVGDASEIGIDDVVQSCLGGDMARLERSLERCRQAGENAITILRAVSRQTLLLQNARALMDGGLSLDQALGAMRPPIRFPRDRAFKQQLPRWSGQRLLDAVDLLVEAELDCKTTGNPADALTARALMRIAGVAARAARR